MRRRLAIASFLGAIILAIILLVHRPDAQTPGDGNSSSIESVSNEYLASLARKDYDGFLEHFGPYRENIYSMEQSNPSNMWAANEAAARAAEKTQLLAAIYGNGLTLDKPYYTGSSGSCYLIVRGHADVKVQEIRILGQGSWRVFYSVSYPTWPESAIIALNSGKQRFLQSAVLSVDFYTSLGGEILATDNCALINDVTWPVPPLNSDQALMIAQRWRALPTQWNSQVSSSAGVGSEVNWNGWTDFVAAAQLMKSTLETDGWTVSGFQPSSMYYYDIRGTIQPPADAQQWILGPATQGYVGGETPGYNAVFLDHAENTVVSFNLQDDTATEIFKTTFSGCTAFCQLWEDAQLLPPNLTFEFDYRVFSGLGKDRQFDPNHTVYQTTIHFAWAPMQDWHPVDRQMQPWSGD